MISTVWGQSHETLHPPGARRGLHGKWVFELNLNGVGFEHVELGLAFRGPCRICVKAVADTVEDLSYHGLAADSASFLKWISLISNLCKSWLWVHGVIQSQWKYSRWTLRSCRPVSLLCGDLLRSGREIRRSERAVPWYMTLDSPLECQMSKERWWWALRWDLFRAQCF